MLLCLLLASLAFYGYWNPIYLLLLIPSMSVNYLIGQRIISDPGRGKGWLVLGITVNLGLLGWFKYRNFLLDSFSNILSTEIELTPLLLPLAISFFTFQQIAYLVDVKNRLISPGSLLQYMTFVAFFPQLIAGPIVHYQQVSGQFSTLHQRRFDCDFFATGLALFSIGLFKKVILADQLALFATPIFDSTAQGNSVSALSAWSATLSYSFQLYFDFSGYADMALGLAAMFGIRLPANFNSPYKAHSIVDFWQRWHITLSSFLRNYLYIPLGGNRRGNWLRNRNLMVTMLLGGLWHGAGWTFVIWGAMHGTLLILSHTINKHMTGPARAPRPLAIAITFISVSLCWVMFRAENLESAQQIYLAMLGITELYSGLIAVPGLISLGDILYGRPIAVYFWLLICACIVWLLPNTLQWLRYPTKADTKADNNRNGLMIRGVTAGILLFVSLNRMLGQPATEFLYFNF